MPPTEAEADVKKEGQVAAPTEGALTPAENQQFEKLMEGVSVDSVADQKSNVPSGEGVTSADVAQSNNKEEALNKKVDRHTLGGFALLHKAREFLTRGKSAKPENIQQPAVQVNQAGELNQPSVQVIPGGESVTQSSQIARGEENVQPSVNTPKVYEKDGWTSNFPFPEEPKTPEDRITAFAASSNKPFTSDYKRPKGYTNPNFRSKGASQLPTSRPSGVTGHSNEKNAPNFYNRAPVPKPLDNTGDKS